MSRSGESTRKSTSGLGLGLDPDRLREALSLDGNKPDSRALPDLGSPVSPLRAAGPATPAAAPAPPAPSPENPPPQPPPPPAAAPGGGATPGSSRVRREQPHRGGGPELPPGAPPLRIGPLIFSGAAAEAGARRARRRAMCFRRGTYAPRGGSARRGWRRASPRGATCSGRERSLRPREHNAGAGRASSPEPPATRPRLS
uniref:Uncharacterized protein n=1 Tax=Ananas comosus var. bracteatus TaxID=296719 RepID=A0A6V7NZL2_ANACO|nr:unnamed protein product [Ananas comosus var. bracteatus]